MRHQWSSPLQPKWLSSSNKHLCWIKHTVTLNSFFVWQKLKPLHTATHTLFELHPSSLIGMRGNFICLKRSKMCDKHPHKARSQSDLRMKWKMSCCSPKIRFWQVLQEKQSSAKVYRTSWFYTCLAILQMLLMLHRSFLWGALPSQFCACYRAAKASRTAFSADRWTSLPSSTCAALVGLFVSVLSLERSK